MRNLRLAACALASVTALCSFSGVAMAERVALVIGNGAYEHGGRLTNPRNDAEDMGLALTRLGFVVTRLDDARYEDMRQGLMKFEEAAVRSEVAVVFYAGHGIEMDRRNYLIPVDARLESDRKVKHQTMSLDRVMESVEGASKFRLVILDACRDNPFVKSMQRRNPTRQIRRGLARVEPSGETLVAYAAKSGTTAADGAGGRNSPYTKALLRYLEEPGLDVGIMFRRVRDAVKESTGGSQEPFVYGSLSGKGVYLSAPPKGLGSAPDKGPTPNPVEINPGVYLKLGVGAGQKIEESHLEVVAEDRISAREIRNYSMVRNGCYYRRISASTRLEWRHISLCTW